jgi:CheY-like chemotaxis protein
MPRVLVVDDSQDMLESLADGLSLEDFDVTSALDGKLGLERVRESKPDVILLDMMMPEMDGLEFLSRLSAERSPPPVVAYSGFAGFRDEALRRGAHSFLVKPMSLDALIAALRTAMDHRPVQPSTLADNAAGVEKSRRDAQEKTRSAVGRIDEALTLELRDALRRIVRWLPAYLGFGTASVAILRGSEFWFEAIYPSSANFHEGSRCGRELVYCDDVLTAGSTLLLSDPDFHPCSQFAHHHKGNPSWRFYAGVPLTTPSGAVVGTFCIVDSTPHEFRTEDMCVLEALGLAVARGLESQALPLDADGAFGREYLDLFVDAVAARATRPGGAGVIMTVEACPTPPQAAGLAVVRLDGRYALLWAGSVGASAPSEVVAARPLAKIELREERDREQVRTRMRSICA